MIMRGSAGTSTQVVLPLKPVALTTRQLEITLLTLI